MTTKEYNNSVDLYSDNVYRFIIKNLRNTELSKDIVQETYIKLWKKVDEVNAAKVKSWLFTTAYRTMISHIRKEKKHGYDIEEADTNSMYSQQESSDLGDILDEALELLPDVQKHVILLRDYEGYDYKEIGELTGLKESQVKVYIYRARKALKKYLVSVETII